MRYKLVPGSFQEDLMAFQEKPGSFRANSGCSRKFHRYPFGSGKVQHGFRCSQRRFLRFQRNIGEFLKLSLVFCSVSGSFTGVLWAFIMSVSEVFGWFQKCFMRPVFEKLSCNPLKPHLLYPSRMLGSI